MQIQGCNVRSIGGRPLLMGRPSTVRSLGLLAITSHVARHSGLTMPSLTSNRIIHSGFRFMQPPHRAQTVLRFQSRSCNSPINGPRKTHLSLRHKNNDFKNNLKLTLLNAVFRSSNKSTVAERFKDVIFCIRKFISWQCENQTSQRLQKSLKYYSKFSTIWKDQSMIRILGTLRRMLLTRCHLLISAVGVYSYDWETKGISDDAIKRGEQDMKMLDELFKRTIICSRCGKRQVIDQKIAAIDYCMCDGKLGYTSTSRTYDGWVPFIERDNVIVWRKPHEVHTHLFQFKVYGRYEDVSLSAFTESQLNADFRTEWDFTALQLSILHSQKESNSDLLYWLVKFPSFFSNRDYLFKRRFHLNKESQEVTIINEALGGNEIVPEVKGVVRVSEYWSVTVIRPLDQTSKPGMEYSLTYFDDPGTRLPQSVSNFIATTGFPNFLRQNYKAALTLQSRHEKGEDVYVNLPYILRYPDAEIDVKTSEEHLPLDQETEKLPLQNVLEKEIEISDSNQTVTSAQIECHESGIQLQIEEKSDILQNDTSHIVNIDKIDELEIKNHTNLTKDEELVSSNIEINLQATKILVKDEETFVKEEMLNDKIALMKSDLNENNITSEYNENVIEQEKVSDSKVENLIEIDKLTPSIYNENESISEDIIETSIINIEQKILPEGMESRDSKDNEYENVFVESDKYSQRENDNAVQIDKDEGLHDMKIEVPGLHDMKIEVPVGSKTLIVDLLEAMEVTSPEFEQKSDNLVQINKNENIPDTKIEVPIGSKKVIVVDLLEAMEVISPELEHKTVLLKKVEDWTEAALKDIDNNTEFIQYVKKLRAKIENFKEHAKNKKIQALKIMEEMEKQNNKEGKLKPSKVFRHYDHSGGLDERTLLTLEKFLFTMKDIADRDKDMRTGRGYSIDSSENLEVGKQHIFRFRKTMSEESNTETKEKIPGDKQYQEKIKHDGTESPTKNEGILIQNNDNHKITNVNRVSINEYNDDISKDVKNESRTENNKEDPPKDPPKPSGTKLKENNGMSNVENIPTADNAQMNNVKNEFSSENGNKYFESNADSWFYRYIPGMYFFGGGNNKVFDEGSVLVQCDQIEEKSSQNIDTQSSSWYTFGLDGYFKKTSKAQESDSSVSRKETENTKGCENVTSNGTSWYWYPMIGVHKLYSWAWNAG